MRKGVYPYNYMDSPEKFKGGPSDLGTKILRKFYKNTKESSLYSQSFLNFIHRTPVVERHPIRKKSEIYYGPCRHQQETRSIFT